MILFSGYQIRTHGLWKDFYVNTSGRGKGRCFEVFIICMIDHENAWNWNYLKSP